jgi:hypothetical protein
VDAYCITIFRALGVRNLFIHDNYLLEAIALDIKEGSLVMYKGTGTTGVVKFLKDDEDGQWAFLDSTGLYYHISTLEPIDKIPERREIGGGTLDDLERLMKSQQEMMDKAKMQDENLETGG